MAPIVDLFNDLGPCRGVNLTAKNEALPGACKSGDEMYWDTQLNLVHDSTHGLWPHNHQLRSMNNHSHSLD